MITSSMRPSLALFRVVALNASTVRSVAGSEGSGNVSYTSPAVDAVGPRVRDPLGRSDVQSAGATGISHRLAQDVP